MNTFFPEIRKNFGFGCMRFPMAGDQVDIPAVTEMVNAFLAAGFNYVEYKDPKVQIRACYEICCKHCKPVLVMEPAKGDSLVNLSPRVLERMASGSPASCAIRFAAGIFRSPDTERGVSRGEFRLSRLPVILHVFGRAKALPNAVPCKKSFIFNGILRFVLLFLKAHGRMFG